MAFALTAGQEAMLSRLVERRDRSEAVEPASVRRRAVVATTRGDGASEVGMRLLFDSAERQPHLVHLLVAPASTAENWRYRVLGEAGHRGRLELVGFTIVRRRHAVLPKPGTICVVCEAMYQHVKANCAALGTVVFDDVECMPAVEAGARGNFGYELACFAVFITSTVRCASAFGVPVSDRVSNDMAHAAVTRSISYHGTPSMSDSLLARFAAEDELGAAALLSDEPLTAANLKAIAERGGSCPVCFETIDDEAMRCVTPCCSTSFCLPCGVRAVSASASCPWCRAQGLYAHQLKPYPSAVEHILKAIDSSADAEMRLVEAAAGDDAGAAVAAADAVAADASADTEMRSSEGIFALCKHEADLLRVATDCRNQVDATVARVTEILAQSPENRVLIVCLPHGAAALRAAMPPQFGAASLRKGTTMTRTLERRQNRVLICPKTLRSIGFRVNDVTHLVVTDPMESTGFWVRRTASASIVRDTRAPGVMRPPLHVVRMSPVGHLLAWRSVCRRRDAVVRRQRRQAQQQAQQQAPAQ
jgi:hypothetical protein